MDKSDKKIEFYIKICRALIQYLPGNDRKNARDWLNKIVKSDSGLTACAAVIEEEYLKYLLSVLQDGRLTIPFCRVPPGGKLRPLSQAMPCPAYVEAKEKCLETTKWIDELDKDSDPCQTDAKESMTVKGVKPDELYNSQPKPNNGFLVYCSAFSDYQNFS